MILLRKVDIFGFKSVMGPVTLNVEKNTTILIGANDHGKSNILDAIAKLNQDNPITKKERNWDIKPSKEPSLVFELEVDESFWHAVQQYLVDPANGFLVQKDGKNQARLRAESTGEEQSTPPESVAEQSTTEQANETEQTQKVIETIERDILNAIGQFSSRIKRLQLIRDGADSSLRIAGEIEQENLPDVVSDVIKVGIFNFIPRVEKFEGTGKVIDSVTLEQLGTADYEFMQGIFRKAGIWENRNEVFSTSPEARKLLANASTELTKTIREEWQQGESLSFKLELGGTEGNRIDLLIHDPVVNNRYVNPSERSTGFSAFFELHLRLFARKEANPANQYIFLFDEPGIYLHPRGQVNLQAAFEAMSDKNQICYATHCLFLINKNFPSRNRSIKKTLQGTLIDQKPFKGNWKEVKANLGLILSNNFYIADTTLLVEGSSDTLFLSALFSALNRLGKVDIDLNLFSLHDGGNEINYAAMAKLMVEENRKIVALVDGDEGGTKIANRLQQINEGLVDELKPFVIDIHKLDDNKSTEDMLPYRDLLVNSATEACQQLINEGIRSLKPDIEAAQIKAQIEEAVKQQGNKTLGRVFDEVTSNIMGDGESVSKVMIARLYTEKLEAKVQANQINVSDTEGKRALKLVKELSEKLQLRRKTAEGQVFEE